MEQEFIKLHIDLDSNLYQFFKEQLADIKEEAKSSEDETMQIFLNKSMTLEKYLEVLISRLALSQMYE